MQDIADYLSLIDTVRQKLDQAHQDPSDCHGSGLQAVAIASDRVDPDHGLLMRLGLSSRRHRSRRGATILSTMALGAQAVTAVASQVEHTDVDPDVRLLLLSQPGRYKRQGGMEAPPNRGVSGILE
jgi:hypothetical protein